MLYNHSYGYDNPNNLDMKDDVNNKVSSSIKPIDKDKANIEAEKGELIIAPDLSTIHKITGKKHSRGGSPIQADANSFIFSDTKALAFTKKEKELFQFKEGGKVDSPAKILAREVNIKHHNQMSHILGDNKNRDEISKKTASLMLEKNIEKMGQVAYLQEAKKGFPDGVPDFAKGTAPVYRKSVTDKIDAEKQYVKYGGKILGRMAYGGMSGEVIPCPCGKDAEGNCLPCPDNIYKKILPTARPVDAPLPGYDPLFTDPTTNSQLYGKFGTIPGTPGTAPGKGSHDFNVAFGEARKSGVKSFVWNGKTYGTDIYKPGSSPTDTEDYIRVDPRKGNVKITSPVPAEWQTPVKPGDIDIKTGSYLDQKVPFTPWQMGNMAYAALQSAAVKRYMPYRPQINPLTVELEKINPNQQLNDIDTEFNTAANIGKIISNAAQVGANTANLFVKALEAKNQIRTGVDNANVGIGNQQNLTNNQIVNNARGANMQSDKRYYDESTAAYQNYDIEKRTATNQAVSLANLYKTGNMQLQNALAQQEQFPLMNADGTPRKDKAGNPVYGPAYSYDFNGNFIHNRANGFNQVGFQLEGKQQYNRLYEIYNNAIESGTERERTAAMLGMSKLFASKNYPYKMGGSVIPKMPKLQKPKFK